MPKYEITGPDGARYEVEAPDENALNAAVSQAFGGEQAPQPKGFEGMGGAARAFAGGAAQGATFGGIDEAFAAAQSGGDKAKFDQLMQQYQGQINAAKQQQGLAYMAGEVVGAIGGALTGSGLVAKMMPKTVATIMQGLNANTATRITGAAGTGAVSGGLYGFGTGQGDIGKRAENAADVGLYGAAGGAAGSVVASKASGVVSSLADRAKSLFTKKAAQNTPAPLEKITKAASMPEPATRGAYEGAISKISKAIKTDFGDKAPDLLAGLKSGNLTLAEINSPSLQKLTLGSAQYQSGEKVAREFFESKAEKMPSRLEKTIKSNLGKMGEYYTTVDDIVAAGRKKAKPLYDAAYAKNLSMDSPQIDKILDTPAGRAALKKTATTMQNEMQLMGVPDKELKKLQMDATELGLMDEFKGPISRGLSLRTLDEVKKNLGDMVQAQKDQFGVLSNEGKSIDNVRRALTAQLDKLDKAGGKYALARKKAGDYLSIKESMDMGKNEFFNNDAELVKKTFQGLGEAEKRAYKNGVIKAVRDKIYSQPTERVNVYKKILGSMENQKKFSSIMTPDEYKAFKIDLQAEKKLFDLERKVLGNSTTTSKAIAAGAFDDNLSEIVEQAASVNVGNMKTSVAKLLTRMRSGLSEETAGEVAKILYATEPRKKLALIEKLGKSGKVKLTPQEREKAVNAVFEIESALRQKRQISVPGAVAGGVYGVPETQSNQEAQ